MAKLGVEFHLAYVANLEATFTPLFKMVFENRRQLFEGGDERVGTLLLWRFVEEIEHRSSALHIHHHVTSDRWYRIRKARKIFDHVAGIYKLILAGFEKHVPIEDRHLTTRAVGPGGLWLGELSGRLPILRRRGRDTTRPGNRCPRGSTTGTRRTTPAPTSPPTRARDYETRRYQVRMSRRCPRGVGQGSHAARDRLPSSRPRRRPLTRVFSSPPTLRRDPSGDAEGGPAQGRPLRLSRSPGRVPRSPERLRSAGSGAGRAS